MLGDFARKGIHFKALDLGVDSSTSAGKLVLQIFAALAEYDGTGHPAGEYSGEN
jgi:DNA invertase Pin-like site-specific DNA recombinase